MIDIYKSTRLEVAETEPTRRHEAFDIRVLLSIDNLYLDDMRSIERRIGNGEEIPSTTSTYLSKLYEMFFSTELGLYRYLYDHLHSLRFRPFTAEEGYDNSTLERQFRLDDIVELLEVLDPEASDPVQDRVEEEIRRLITSSPTRTSFLEQQLRLINFNMQFKPSDRYNCWLRRRYAQQGSILYSYLPRWDASISIYNRALPAFNDLPIADFSIIRTAFNTVNPVTTINTLNGDTPSWGQFELSQDVLPREATDGEECSVCFEMLCSPEDVSSCKHPICKSCLSQLTQDKCPMCRGDISPEVLSRISEVRILTEDINRRLRDALREVSPSVAFLFHTHLSSLYGEDEARSIMSSAAFTEFMESVYTRVLSLIKSYQLTASNFSVEMERGTPTANALIGKLTQFIEKRNERAYEDISECIISRIIEANFQLPQAFHDIDPRIESFNRQHYLNLKHAIISNIKRLSPQFLHTAVTNVSFTLDLEAIEEISTHPILPSC